MTQSEIKAKESEINRVNSRELEENTLNIPFSLQYSFVNGIQQFRYVASKSGYLTVYLTKDFKKGHYHFRQKTHLFQAEESIFLRIQENELFEIQSDSEQNKIMLIYIDCQEIPTHILSPENNESIQQGKTIPKDYRTKLALSQILEHEGHNDYLSQMKIKALAFEMFIYQLEGLLIKNNAHEITGRKNHYEKIQQVKNLIDADLSKNHTISDLAKSVGTNEQYLKIYFKRYYSKTVMNYITHMKMELAKKLILEGKYRVSDVASMTGYKHSTHFTTAFKKHFGIIPNSLKYTVLFSQITNHYIPNLIPEFFGF